VSVENGGNGALTYPVGLITVDEIVAAGSGKYGTTNQSYYLYKNSWYWSFSPYHADSPYVRVFVVYDSGDMYSYDVTYIGYVAPVINIKPEYINQLKGTGTTSDPYRLED